MNKNIRDWLSIVIRVTIAFIILWKILGFEVSKSLINLTNAVPLIITGFIGVLIGLRRKDWGLFL
jgi:hypothetical protein